MPDSNYRRYYQREDFTSLATGPVPLALLVSALGALTLETPFDDVKLLPSGGVAVEWGELPTAADVAAVDGAVAAFEGGETTSQPFEFNSFDVSTNASGDPVAKIHETTPPLEAGTYQVLWTSSLRMQAVAANTGVEGKIRLERSDGVAVQQTDAWDLNVRHAFNGAITFVVAEGQTIEAELSFLRLGASGTAEMSGARLTIDRL